MAVGTFWGWNRAFRNSACHNLAWRNLAGSVARSLRSAGARDVKNYGRAFAARRGAGTLLGDKSQPEEQGDWRWTRFLHPSNTWRPRFVCARLKLVSQQRPWPHRFRAACAAGLPGRRGGPGAAERPGRAGLHPESEATWDRRDERPIPLQPKPRLQIDRRRPVACALAQPNPPPSLFLFWSTIRLRMVLAVGCAGFKSSA